MKIADIRAVPVEIHPQPRTAPRVPRLTDAPEMVSPMRRYGDFQRSDWSPRGWGRTACVVTADDGTYGVGFTIHHGPVTSIINDHLGPTLVGQNCMATERLWDVMQRSTAQYGTAGIASYAISAVDNALWDLKGKILGRPVYELLGGTAKGSDLLLRKRDRRRIWTRKQH